MGARSRRTSGHRPQNRGATHRRAANVLARSLDCPARGCTAAVLTFAASESRDERRGQVDKMAMRRALQGLAQSARHECLLEATSTSSISRCELCLRLDCAAAAPVVCLTRLYFLACVQGSAGRAQCSNTGRRCVHCATAAQVARCPVRCMQTTRNSVSRTDPVQA